MSSGSKEGASELSILIPARNEMFLKNTVRDITDNMRADTEIIVVLDGQWPLEPLRHRGNLNVVYVSQSIGQRAATNVACKLSKAKYVMKVDAHCSFDKGFDSTLIEDMQDDWTVVPTMKNLHVFDWVCVDCGNRRYQGPTGKCDKCGGEEKREIMWRAKPSPNSTAYRFDKTLKFAYWGEYKKKQKGDLVETMSLQGSCFMMTRKRYWELNICDEEWGSWGNQGTEVALKSWLSGGRVIVNKKTWYAHMFRTQGGDFGFPYPLSGREVERARKCSRDLFLQDKWDKAKRPLSWLIEKFNPPEWCNQ
jgi:glycosyltransferase involved in cell wall biosynthesis